MKIASWNINSLKIRLEQVLEWLPASGMDILALQETKLTDDKFPAEEIKAAGYQVVYSGQPTYNGVAIISKTPLTDIVTDVPDLDDPQRRILAATIQDPTLGAVRVLDLYVVNGQAVGTEKFAYKLDWLEKVTNFIAAEVQQYENYIVLGDFNIAPKDEDVHDPEEWRDKILCSKEERDALQKILDLGFTDTYRLFEQAENSFSWWDYRAAGFRRNRGLRIDLVLASQALVAKCKQAGIDKEPRTWERPSDHTPAWAEFE